MTQNNDIQYNRIGKAIAYMHAHYHEQPSLNDLAAEAGLSPDHFQRVFRAWAGISPKKFIQYLTLEHAKACLDTGEPLLNAAYDSGLSGTGRLHDLFLSIERMSPGTYKKGAAGLTITYDIFPSHFGEVLIAATDKGICYLGFEGCTRTVFDEFQSRFPKANIIKGAHAHHTAALQYLNDPKSLSTPLAMHLTGTTFQIKVWESLLKIPPGGLVSYGDIAADIEKPKANRAVGTAIGRNPISVIIPCHRVIQSTGHFGNYLWGTDKKAQLIGYEAAQREHKT